MPSASTRCRTCRPSRNSCRVSRRAGPRALARRATRPSRSSTGSIARSTPASPIPGLGRGLPTSATRRLRSRRPNTASSSPRKPRNGPRSSGPPTSRPSDRRSVNPAGGGPASVCAKRRIAETMIAVASFVSAAANSNEGRPMSFTRRAPEIIAVLALAVWAPVAAFAQSAAQWPDRPVRLLVPVGAGGAADTLSRNLSNGFPQFANGQPLIVENRPGAGGTLAAAAVAREKPDGYTLFLAEVGPNAVSHMLTAALPYDPHTAFTPIIHVANLPAVVLIRSSLPYATLPEFVAAAKQQPGKFNYASAGPGNWTHLFMAYLNSQAG